MSNEKAAVTQPAEPQTLYGELERLSNSILSLNDRVDLLTGNLGMPAEVAEDTVATPTVTQLDARIDFVLDMKRRVEVIENRVANGIGELEKL